MKMASMAFSAIGSSLVWLAVAVVTVGFTTLIAIVTALLWFVDPKRAVAHTLCSAWGQSVLMVNPFWRVTVQGRERIQPGKAYVLVSNHQSMFDIMALFSLRRQFKWVAKDSLFKIPFLGWSMAMARYVRLVRGERGSIRETYGAARRWLQQGVSVFFFPEGTRTLTGAMLPFKNGAFKLALDANVPVVPIAVVGTRDLLVKGSWRVRGRCHVKIQVLPPIQTSKYEREDDLKLRDDARRAIEHALQRLTADNQRMAPGTTPGTASEKQ